MNADRNLVFNPRLSAFISGHTSFKCCDGRGPESSFGFRRNVETHAVVLLFLAYRMSGLAIGSHFGSE
jgi:hypothetical protein